MMHYWFYGPGYYSGFSILGFLFQIFFWSLVVILIVKLFKYGSHSRHCCKHEEMEDDTVEDRSLEIVKERYAKGEIDKKEFEQLKKDLSN